MADLKRLHDEHVNLVAIARRLWGLIGQDEPPISGELYTIRMELASALLVHLKSEDWVLYPQLMASSDTQVAETARAFSEEMGGLATAFRCYADRWGACAIERDWKRYQHETAEILSRLKHRMMREERELYPLLDKSVRAVA